MSLKWHLNESPISSEKMNKLSVTKLLEGERNSLTQEQKIEGMIIYNLTKHRFEYWNGNSWRPVGGGSMLSMIGYKRYSSFDSSGYFLFFASGSGRATNGDTRWLGNLSPALFTNNASTLTSSAEHILYANRTDLGRAISKVYITFPCVIGGTYSTSQNITVTLTTIRFDILDGSSIIASDIFTMNKTYTRINATSLYTGHIVNSIIDVGDKEITQFKLKVSVTSNITSTNLQEHRHYWYADVSNTEPTQTDFHPLEVQLLLL